MGVFSKGKISINNDVLSVDGKSYRLDDCLEYIPFSKIVKIDLISSEKVSDCVKFLSIPCLNIWNATQTVIFYDNKNGFEHFKKLVNKKTKHYSHYKEEYIKKAIYIHAKIEDVQKLLTQYAQAKMEIKLKSVQETTTTVSFFDMIRHILATSSMSENLMIVNHFLLVWVKHIQRIA